MRLTLISSYAKSNSNNIQNELNIVKTNLTKTEHNLT